MPQALSRSWWGGGSRAGRESGSWREGGGRGWKEGDWWRQEGVKGKRATLGGAGGSGGGVHWLAWLPGGVGGRSAGEASKKAGARAWERGRASGGPGADPHSYLLPGVYYSWRGALAALRQRAASDGGMFVGIVGGVLARELIRLGVAVAPGAWNIVAKVR
jgi:hypothetical protein